jgi:hypothetical protein
LDIKPEVGLALLVLFFLARGGQAATLPHSPNVSTGQKKPATHITITPVLFRRLLREAFERATGRLPLANEEALLLAHSAAETGRWKSMWNFNPGFVTTSGTLDYFEGREIDPNNTLLFRSYDTMAAGLDDWIDVLRRDFPDAWAHVDGDVAQYVDGLYHGRHGSYFGGQEVYAKYQRLVNSLFNEFLNWTSLGPDKSLVAPPRGGQAAAPPQGAPWALPVTWRLGARRKKR